MQTIKVIRCSGDYRIAMHHGLISFEPELGPDLRHRIGRALGLAADELISDLPVQIVSTRHSKVMVPLGDGTDLDGITPDNKALVKISSEIGCNGFFPFLIRRNGANATDGRMFAPAIGIDEDPVTGNANGPLGAYLVRYGPMCHDGRTLKFEGHQERAMHREGVVHGEVDIEESQPKLVKIQGNAVNLFTVPFDL
nr:PhzF family phenazine biosynthesis isomerase [Pandoraea apista]